MKRHKNGFDQLNVLKLPERCMTNWKQTIDKCTLNWRRNGIRRSNRTERNRLI